MITKIIFYIIFVIVGIVYTDLGLVINEFLNTVFPNINLGSFFTPLVAIDVVIAFIYSSILQISIYEKNISWLNCFINLICAIFLSIISSFGWGIGRFIIEMNF